ncbi:unnamed protein product [Clavelina lepadiformis]|uniref:Uncharacterized protein n=1 Tax=Clavelina lepadiformis TaxID=159417 RepID=A0ABP0GV03_CLALP
MKVFVAITFLIGAVCGQVYFLENWPENERTPAGAKGMADFSNLGNGTCYLLFPGAVYWFHCENCDIVPGKSNSAEGIYALATPNQVWQNTGAFIFVVNFLQDAAYSSNSIGWVCDADDKNTVTVYSFPNNMDEKRTRSRVCDYDLNEKSAIMIDLPASVNEFKVDSPNTVMGGPQIYKIGNIKSWQTEVAFELTYNNTWFGAADLGVSVVQEVQEEEEEEEEKQKRRRRNAHY